MKPRLSLIIDDIGPSVFRAKLFSVLDIPMTFAVLPHFPKSEYLALEFHNAGHEIMLHQPMEPLNPEVDPGPGALYVGDGPDKIVKIMEKNIAAIPYATGVNNHMGSKFTTHQKEMHQTLEIVKGRGLFFIDSLTASDSKGYKTAKRLHMPSACRNIFLDNEPDARSILRQLLRLADVGLCDGHAIGIGHPFPETAKAIKIFLKDFRDSGIKFVGVSQLVAE
ncbi:MAG: divergent polysaccharide deacetylase family protein [Deltaproteobacteria bacterium]|nr:divergent polysaccharide deacetylase family protein [Deltaproteobacteria bacterium]